MSEMPARELGGLMSGTEQAWALFHCETLCLSSGNSVCCSRGTESRGLQLEHAAPHIQALWGPGEVAAAPLGRLELVSETKMAENSSWQLSWFPAAPAQVRLLLLSKTCMNMRLKHVLWIYWEKADYKPAVIKDTDIAIKHVTGFFVNFCLFIIVPCHNPLKPRKYYPDVILPISQTGMKIPRSLDRQTEYFHYN